MNFFERQEITANVEQRELPVGYVVAVLGYGTNLEPLKPYLNKVIGFQRQFPVSLIVCCGGFTSKKSSPDKSEASVMAQYLEPYCVAEIALEESSTTTAENLVGLKKIIEDKGFGSRHLVVFCNQAHSWKVRALGRMILGFSPELRTFDLTKNLIKKVFQKLVATPLSLLAFRFKLARKLERAYKEKKMNRA